MLTDSLMILLAAIGAAFMTVALIADLLGLRITTALAIGLAGWCWLSAGEIAFVPHEQRTAAIASMKPQAEPASAGKRFFNRYYESNAP
jgi:hypothetical protein